MFCLFFEWLAQKVPSKRRSEESVGLFLKYRQKSQAWKNENRKENNCRFPMSLWGKGIDAKKPESNKTEG